MDTTDTTGQQYDAHHIHPKQFVSCFSSFQFFISSMSKRAGESFASSASAKQKPVHCSGLTAKKINDRTAGRDRVWPAALGPPEGCWKVKTEFGPGRLRPGPKGGGPKISRFFFPLPPPFSFFFSLSGGSSRVFFFSLWRSSHVFFFSLWRSSRVFFSPCGSLLVEFWWCFGRPGPSNVRVFALGLSCESPRRRRRSSGLHTNTPHTPHTNTAHTPTQHTHHTPTQHTHQHSTRTNTPTPFGLTRSGPNSVKAGLPTWTITQYVHLNSKLEATPSGR